MGQPGTGWWQGSVGDSSQGQKRVGGKGELPCQTSAPPWWVITAAPRQRGLIGRRASKLTGIPPRGWQCWGEEGVGLWEEGLFVQWPG